MITEQDLQAAIAECQGVKNPTANTCIKLAAFYTIKNEMFGNSEKLSPEPVYSFADKTEDTITYESGSEFSDAIHGKTQRDVWPVIDELMQTLQLVQPRLYASVLRKL